MRRPKRCRARALWLLGFAVAQAPRVATAETPPTVAVVLGDGAAGCPGAAELEERAARLAGVDRPEHEYRISFDRTGGLYAANVADQTSPRSRQLADRSATCAPLGEAVAVVLATMWTSERVDAPASPTPPPPPAPAAPPPVSATSALDDREAPSPTRSSPPRTSLGVGSGAAGALVRAVAPVFLADVSLELAHASFSLGGLWIPSERLGDGPGFVDVTLVAGDARGCLSTGDVTRFGGCARFFAGALFAGGAGYATDVHATRPWFAAALEIFVGGPIAPRAHLRYRLAFDAIAPVHAEEFSVSGAGIAYQTPSFGGLLALSIELGSR